MRLVTKNNGINPREKLTTRALTVWAAGVLFYIVAVAGRTSFGVAGAQAIERFHSSASGIAVFTAVQIGVYALAQIPVGLLIDRYGPRRVLIVGAIFMAVGQLTLGLTTSYGLAIGARVLIGAGDATAFLAVMRILPYWFPLRWTPLFTQLTSSLGQLGQFFSAIPFLLLLDARGWSFAFVALGAVGGLIAIAAGLTIAEPPQMDSSTSTAKTKQTIGPVLKEVLSLPVCWQAFFIHWTAMIFQIVFTLLWGVPLMTMGMGLSNAQAGMILTLNTLVVICAGPLLGPLSARLGLNRDLAVVVVTAIMGIAWIVFIASGQQRTLTALIILTIVMAASTPVSNFGFDSVRDSVNRHVVATGTGLANMGGFLSGMVASQLVGIVLDWSADGQSYGWDDFRVAWIAVLIMWAIGIVGILVTRVLIRRNPRRTTRTVTITEEDPS